MTPAWGLAETVTIATTSPPDAGPRIEAIDRQSLAASGAATPTDGEGLESIGLGPPIPGASVEIRDPAGQPLPARRIGTIWARSDCLFAGYHQDAEATARAIVDGWLDTGDQGYLADGDLFFVARDKDLVVIGGDKYAPHDIEAAVNGVAGVRQGCAVAFGVLDEERGTEDLAVIAETHITEPAERDALAHEVRAAVTAATGLGARHLLLVAPGGVEKTSSGKLARRATRARHAAALGIAP